VQAGCYLCTTELIIRTFTTFNDDALDECNVLTYASHRSTKLHSSSASYNLPQWTSSLQRVTATMIELQHNKLFKHYYALMIFLLTLHVTSSGERAHSKVDIVKSAVRASMASERIADLILIFSENTVLDTLNIPVIIDTFAALQSINQSINHPCDLLCTAQYS